MLTLIGCVDTWKTGNLEVWPGCWSAYVMFVCSLGRKNPNPQSSYSSQTRALCPVMPFSREGGGSRGLVTARNIPCDWPSRSRPGPSPIGCPWRRHADQLLELHNNNKRRSSRGTEEETDWRKKEKKDKLHCDSWCTVLKVTFFYILFLPRRNLKFFYLS